MKNLDTINHGALAAFARRIVVHGEALGNHSCRVGELAVELGRELGLSGSALISLRWAGQLHDLGKTVIARSLLMKTEALDEAEWTAIETHPVIGYELLIESSPEFHDLALAVRSHHERWDGLGYPNHLSGEAISLFGRIVAIVDVYDALTSHRPYRPVPFSHDAAVHLIRAESGSHFDPAMVDAFLELERRGTMNASRADGPMSAESCRMKVSSLAFDPRTARGCVHGGPLRRSLHAPAWPVLLNSHRPRTTAPGPADSL